MKNRRLKKQGDFLVVSSYSTIRFLNDGNNVKRRYTLYYHWKKKFECDTRKELMEYFTENGYDISGLKFDYVHRNICDYKTNNWTEPCGLKNQISYACFRGIVRRNRMKTVEEVNR